MQYGDLLSKISLPEWIHSYDAIESAIHLNIFSSPFLSSSIKEISAIVLEYLKMLLWEIPKSEVCFSPLNKFNSWIAFKNSQLKYGQLIHWTWGEDNYLYFNLIFEEIYTSVQIKNMKRDNDQHLEVMKWILRAEFPSLLPYILDVKYPRNVQDKLLKNNLVEK